MLTAEDKAATEAAGASLEWPTPAAGQAATKQRAIRRLLWKLRNEVILVGYSADALGGVTTVTSVLTGNISYLHLHPALRWYRPLWKSIGFLMYSFSGFLFRLLVAAPRVVQVVVGSRGDALRMLPFIVFAKLRGCKVCLHFHTNRGAIFGGLPGALGRTVLAVWRRADAYCFLSNRLRDEYDGQFDRGKPCVVIPNPIAAEWLQQNPNPRNRRTRDMVFLGRWSAEKGIDELLSVVKTLDLATHCDIYSDHCPAIDPANCVCHPWLPRDAVRQVLRDAKLLLLPSHAEAFPTVLLEAAACGAPFVASNVAGIQDIAEQSGGGLLHEVGDVQGMREAVVRLMTDEALWNECSRNGRRWVESLETSRIIPHWHRLYAELGVENL